MRAKPENYCELFNFLNERSNERLVFLNVSPRLFMINVFLEHNKLSSAAY